ncbi:hypothetical protein [Mycolicibacterium llatzerense]|uniref:hypothetical protein n=1 Tax=Mycolicibacterium llatzerense TaxID=280871 RepID=UPI0008DC8B70|nr:hypothetical protein [Mycolicibacterium llatzerense]
MSTNIVESDAITWVLNRSHYCDAPHCSQPAAIVAASAHNDRFCLYHSEAAADAAADPAFAGWYRIESTHYCGHVLVATVHAI